MRDWILHKIARAVTRAPWFILSAALILTTISIWYSKTHLELNTDQDDLVSEKIEYHKRYKDFLREFGDLEYLYVVVDVNNSLESSKQFLEALSERLEKIPEIKEVVYKISNPALERSFLLYLSEPQLAQLRAFLGTGPTSIKNIAEWNSLNNILKPMNRMMEAPKPETAQEEMRAGFNFINELITGMDSTLATGKPYQPELAGAFLGTDQVIDEEGYLLSSNGKLLFCLIMPQKSYNTLSVIEEPLAKIRSAIDLTKKEFPGIKAGLTGRPVLQADEMSITNSDMTKATILALIAVALFFVLYFKRLARPLMAILSLVFGISWTFGLTTLVIGYLNLLSSVFAIVLIGAGIEFGLQVVSRYREELHDHKDPRLAVMNCITKTGKGNFTAALTTAAAFFTVFFTDFKALRELGFIAGMGILLCLASLIIVLPAMMYLRDRARPKGKLRTDVSIDLKGIDHLYRRPWLILIILAAVTIAGLPGLFKLRFDHNLLNLQAKGLESVDYERLIIDKSDESTWYAVSITKTPYESAKIASEMRQKLSVGKVESFETIVPADQDKKIEEVHKLKGIFSGISYSNVEENIEKEALLHELKLMSRNLNRLTEMAFGSGHVEAVETLEEMDEKVQIIYSSLAKASPEKLKALSEFQAIFITKFRDGIKMLEDGLDPAHIKMTDLPQSIRGKFISSNGDYAVYVYPKFDIWNPEKMADFVQDIRSVDPSVTGTPVEVYESSKLMQSSFQKAALYALIAIVFIVFLDFKKLKYSMLSLAPLLAGVLWLLEAMGWAGIPFNLANFFAIPILLGVGVDNGVQIVHRYLQGGRDIKVMSTSTGAAVLLTSLTTGTSFGMMILGSHRGIQSLGLIMTLGAITCLIGSMLLLPAILKLIGKK